MPFAFINGNQMTMKPITDHKPTNVIDLSFTRKQEIRWLGQNSIDIELLNQCAMYPKPPSFGQIVSGCTSCSVSQPKKTCKYAHVMMLDQIPKRNNQKVDNLLKGLRKEDLDAVRKFIEERRK